MEKPYADWAQLEPDEFKTFYEGTQTEPQLQPFLVHATNPENLDSIIQKGILLPNKEFGNNGIKTPLAAAYPLEDSARRKNDPAVHFSANARSIIPEIAVNLTDRLEDVEYYINSRGSMPPFEIMPVRLYFKKAVFYEVNQVEFDECGEVLVEHPVDVMKGLALIVIPSLESHKVSPSTLEKVSGKYAVLDVSGDALRYSEFVGACNNILKEMSHILS